MTTPEENIEIVRSVAYDTYTGEADLDVIDEHVSEDFVLHDPLRFTEGDLRGPHALKEHVEITRQSFPDFEATIEDIVAEGDVVAARFSGSGTFEGEIPDLDVEPTGETIEMEGMEFDRFEDGKLVETWLMTDTYGVLEQLGVLPEAEATA